jgi:hypothetical protein
MGVKAFLFRLFCSEGWVNAIDDNTLKILPIGLRYRLYDYIITANGAFYPDKVKL